ncbi:ectonucleotide pyrophosphatase/phosphodiesterase family member 5-like isoform X2 [Physella acuta]|uniref:ectonucleotide pyrophosphatase/phosphodiesterase family member 5-like isoform X2 n=1 Tax=Physella acuta TaxID=109671 RepID=UPI0027DBC35D|nr:ectonucleotide pyrophosphatase/phosphodiesterase family member 5-like isoform X2 [Physella acuta]
MLFFYQSSVLSFCAVAVLLQSAVFPISFVNSWQLFRSKRDTQKNTEEANNDALSHTLLLISFDGFRWDYLQKAKGGTPNFDKFIKYGVSAKLGLTNAFVTKTFPNHFTIVTGLWEESHGIVANDMYDPSLNQTFTPSNQSAMEDPAWFSVGAEPIWVTNQLQNPKGRSGVYMWVGGGAPIKWVRPSRYVPYSKKTKMETKINTLIDWFTDEYPINLGLLYSDEPDIAGHAYGPDSPEVIEKIKELDSSIGYLLKRLEEKNLLKSMNIIITSDHGFTNTPENKTIDLDLYIDPTSYKLTATSPIANIWPNEGQLEKVYQGLKNGSESTKSFKVYKREEMPERFHYTNNVRISPLTAVAEDMYSFTSLLYPYPKAELGNHGYDNALQDMHPFFLAMGPSFKKNFALDTFNTVDIYPLMCHLLNVNPAPSNGSMEVVSKLLLGKEEKSSIVTLVTYIIGVFLIALVAGVYILSSCYYSRYRRLTGKYARVDSRDSPAKRADAAENGAATLGGDDPSKALLSDGIETS